MSRHLLTAAVAMLAICPAAAPAQDSPRQASTGFRLEGLIGYDDAAFDSVTRGDGLLYGIGLGYDLGSRRMRFGLEAEASDSTARTCEPLIGGTGNVCLRASRDLYVGARLGIEVAPRVLLYGKAGYTNFAESNLYPPSVGSIVTHPHSDGIRFGLGAEFALSGRTFIKAEYRYSRYERAQDFDRNQAVLGFGFRF